MHAVHVRVYQWQCIIQLEGVTVSGSASGSTGYQAGPHINDTGTPRWVPVSLISKKRHLWDQAKFDVTGTQSRTLYGYYGMVIIIEWAIFPLFSCSPINKLCNNLFEVIVHFYWICYTILTAHLHVYNKKYRIMNDLWKRLSQCIYSIRVIYQYFKYFAQIQICDQAKFTVSHSLRDCFECIFCSDILVYNVVRP